MNKINNTSFIFGCFSSSRVLPRPGRGRVLMSSTG